MEMTVTGKSVGAPWALTETTTVFFSITPLYYRRGPDVYENLLGTESSVFPDTMVQPTEHVSLYWVSGISPTAFAVLDLSYTTVVQTHNNFKDTTFVTLDFDPTSITYPNGSTAYPLPEVCQNLGASEALGIRFIALFRNYLLVSTRWGLLQGLWTNEDHLVWTVQVDLCVDKVLYPGQYSPFHTEFNELQIIIAKRASSYAIFASPTVDSPFNLLDGWADQSWPSPRPLSASVSLVDQMKVYLFLIDTGSATDAAGRYRVIKYDVDTACWSTEFSFSRYVTADDSGSSVEIELVLYELDFTRWPSRDMFAYGNALFYSATNGMSFYVIKAFSSTTIISLVTSSGGHYAFLTADHQVFFGMVGSSITVQLAKARSSLDSSPTARAIFFDQFSKLFEVSWGGYPDAPRFNRSDALWFDIQDTILFAATVNQQTCPASELTIISPVSPNITRTALTETNSLPTYVFLDKGQSYSVKLQLSKSDDDVVLKAGVQSGRSSLVHITSASTSLSSDTVQLTVQFDDAGAYTDQDAPGEGLDVTPIRVNIYNATYACVDTQRSGDLKSLTGFQMTVYTGCPPARNIVFNASSSNSANGCDEKYGIPCFIYSDDFYPVFSLHDTITGDVTAYTGQYYLNIIASGKDPSQLSPFPSSVISDYNAGSAPIWSALADVGNPPVYTETNGNNGMNWVCGPKSPCEKVMPVFPHPPEIYFQVLFTTAGSEMSSYCNYTTLFVLRLQGMSMDVTTTVAITFAMFGFLTLSLVIACLYYSRKHPEFFHHHHHA